MKTVVQAISLLIAGMGSAVAMSLTTVSRDPNMVIFYASLAGAMAVTGIVFYCIFRNMNYLPSDGDEGSHRASGPPPGREDAATLDAATRQLCMSLEPVVPHEEGDDTATLPDYPAIRSSTQSGLASLSDEKTMRNSASTTSTTLNKENSIV